MTVSSQTSDALVRASLPRRLMAFVVDLGIIYIPLGVVATLVFSLGDTAESNPPAQPHETGLADLLWFLPALALLTAVFGAFWRLGRSPAMALLGLRAMRLDGGRPAFLQAASRGLLTAIFLFAAFILLSSGFSDPPANGYNTLDLAIIWGAAVICLASLAGYFALLWDGTGQTLQDRLLGLKVVRG